MVASDIISEIIKRMKFWGGRFPSATSIFIPNTRGDSFYLIQNRGENKLTVQIRLSNHGTYLETWTDREELGNSVDRIDPAHSINISIVFVDDGKSITNDCDGQVNCEGCALPICKPQTFDGQNEIGRPFKVFQYVYQSKDIAPRYINALTKAIFHARHTGEYIDPLKDLSRAAKPKEFDSTNLPKEKKPKYRQTEHKQYNKNTNMKQAIRLTESQLHRIIKESVKSVLRENEDEEWKPQDGYFFSISSMKEDDFGEWMDYACYEEQGGFETPEEAYNEGLNSLKWYNQGDFSLSVYFFDDNGAGDYVSGYYAVIHDGDLTEY